MGTYTIKYISSVLCFMTIIACSKNENSLLNDVDISYQGLYIDEVMGSRDMKAWLDNNYDFRGFGNGNSFLTSDEFQNISFKPGSAKGDILYNDFQFIIQRIENEKKELLIQTSSDFGESYTTTVFKKKSESIIGSDGSIQFLGRHSFRKPFFLNKTKGYFISNYECKACAHMPDGINIFSINNGSVEFLDQIENDYYGLDIGFVDENSGWLLADSYMGDNPTRNTYVFKTVDGGDHWGIPTLVAEDQILDKIVVVSDNRLMAYSFKGNYNGSRVFYFSENAGETWEEFDCDFNNIAQIDFITDKIGFLLSCSSSDSLGMKGRVFKTTDGGKTWNVLYKKNIYAEQIDFIDEMNGIAVSKNIVQITKDGGLSWELLLFPFGPN